MVRRQFEIKAAEYYLIEDEITSEEQLVILENLKDEDVIPDDIVIWKPFQYYEGEELLSLISQLADIYESIYNQGITDGKRYN